MNGYCEAFDRWLDEGSPAAREAEAREHAARCPRCAAVLELEAALAVPARSAPPADFADAVLRRVRVEEEHATELRRSGPSAAAAVFQLLLDPLVALAAAAVVLLSMSHDALWKLGVAISRMGRHVAWQRPAWLEFPDVPVAIRSLEAAFASPAWAAALLLALTPVALIAAWYLFHWSERWVEGFIRHGARGWARMHAVVR